MSTRRLILLATLVAVSLALIAPAAEAQTQPFEAHLKELVRKGDPFCATAFFCGTGTVEGYGKATIGVKHDQHRPGPGPAVLPIDNRPGRSHPQRRQRHPDHRRRRCPLRAG
jgi:hypothetical protein